MAHGIELEIVGPSIDSGNQVDKSGHIRNFFSKSNNFGKKPSVPTSKPQCSYYEENHEVWSYRRFRSPTLIYTSELILCFTVCVHSAARHNVHKDKMVSL